MITSNGSPQDYGNYSNLNISFKQCVNYCNEDEKCMMIYEFGSTVCQVFEIGEVKSVKRNYEIGKRFGYKIADSKDSTCPGGGDTVGGEGHYFGTNETSNRQIYQSYSIVYDPVSETWIFNSTAVKMCRSAGWGMFMRDAGPWCMNSITNSYCVNQSEGLDSCIKYFNAVLTGLETPEEFEFVKKSAGLYVNGTFRPLFGTWLDGVRKPECVGNSSCQGIQAFSFSDPFLSENPTGYLWNPNQPVGNSNDCLAWVVNPDGSYGVSDFPCTATQSSDNSTCFYGYMCGMPPA
ncbi:unnamed protein product [Caenorhabditis nigoni]